MKYFKKLVADAIYLSPINPDDYEIYTKWLNDTSIGINFGQACRVITLESEKEFLQKMSKSGINLAIIKLEDDTLIGNVSLMGVDNLNGTAEVGIFIGDCENRGKGFGTEAISLICEYGFKLLNLRNIMLRVFGFNENAIKAYNKIGFKQFGKRTESVYLNGKYHDEIYMEIFSKDIKQNYLNNILP